MKVTVDQDTLTELFVAVTKVFIDPYNDFVVQLVKDGRIEQEEMDKLSRELRDRAKRLPEIVKEGLGGGS
jgi:hypothetical protein